MGVYDEWTDPDFCEKSYRRSPSSSKFAQLLSAVPFWAALAGGLVIGKMLGRSSGSSGAAEGSDRDKPVDEVQTMEGIAPCGPWGGSGGTPFYDGTGDIVEIQVTHNAEHVLGIETSYKHGGSASFKSGPRGTCGVGGQISKIILQYPNEYVMQVTGTTDKLATIKALVVSSLTVITNKQSYGPYGKATGTPFSSFPNNCVVGFFGRADTLLDQLGVLVHSSDTYSTMTTTMTTMSSFDVVEEEKKEPLLIEGPWGGDIGTTFHDGYGRVVEIVVTYHKHHINSLQVSYEHGTLPFPGPTHGIPKGHQTKISLRCPEEYLIEVKGTAGKVRGHDTITSLTFITNQRHFGPFGSHAGKAFESSPSKEVLGFFGKCSSRLDQIGVMTRSHGHLDSTRIQGPWGGDHGSQFSSGRGDLSEIYVTFTKSHIVALQASYHLSTEMTNIKSDSWGGKSLGQTEKVTINFPDEYLIQLKGTIDTVNGIEAVTSLTFITDQRICGPYGSTSGRTFESTPSKVLGFYGRFESILHQIGIITEISSGLEFQKLFGKTHDVTSSSRNEVYMEKAKQSAQDNVDLIITQGPWGGQGGAPFYDGRGDIFEIAITYTESQILSFQASYGQGGVDFQADSHGGKNGTTTTVILDFPEECLVQVQGTVQIVHEENVISSLTIITNKKTYGPYGSDSGRRFQTSSKGIIVGFYGQASPTTLDQIGFIIKMPNSPNHKPCYDTKYLVNSDVLVIPQGPWGGLSGQEFYDGRGDIVDLNISYNKSLVTSIQVGYEQGGTNFQAPLHGGEGVEHVKIKLDSKEEHVLQIKGTSGIVEGASTITSFTVVTNKTTYGPYGGVQGKRFQSSQVGKVVGFFGHSSKILHQLGVIIEIYVPPNNGYCKNCMIPYQYYCGCIKKKSQKLEPFRHRHSDPIHEHYNTYENMGRPESSLGERETQPSTRLDSSTTTQSTKQPTLDSVTKKPKQPSDTSGLHVPDMPSWSTSSTDWVGVPSGSQPGQLGRPGSSLGEKETQPSTPLDSSETTHDTKQPSSGSVTEKPKQPSDTSGLHVPGMPSWSSSTTDRVGVPGGSQPGQPGRPGSSLGEKETQPSTPLDSTTTTHSTKQPSSGFVTEKPKQPSDTSGLHVPDMPSWSSSTTDWVGVPEGSQPGQLERPGSSLPEKETQPSTPLDSSTMTHGTKQTTSDSVTEKPKQPSDTSGLHVPDMPSWSTSSMDWVGVPSGSQPGQPGRPGSSLGEKETQPSTPLDSSTMTHGTKQPSSGSVTEKPKQPSDTSDLHVPDMPSWSSSTTDWVGVPGGSQPGQPGRPGSSLPEKETQPSTPVDSSTTTHGTKQPSSGSITAKPKEASAKPGLDVGQTTGRVGVPGGSEPIEGSLPSQVVTPPDTSSLVRGGGVFEGHDDEVSLVEGPWGSNEETTFYDGNGDITEIEVAFNKQYIVRIQTTFVLSGMTFKQAPRGGPSGDVSKIVLQSPNEYVVQVRGTTQKVSSLGVVVTSLTFVTNKKTYGPYGSTTRGTSFETVPHGKVIGLYGRATSCMHSIGVVSAKGVPEDVSNTKTVIVQEAWGGQGGEPFYEGSGDVSEVLVSYNNLHVVSFQTTYRQGGKTFKGEQHGGQNGVGTNQTKISLKYPEEYLVQVKGSSHLINGLTIIESLEFITNKQSYGPYGALKPQGQLKSTPKNGKIVGFFGKAGHFVDQLGVVISFPSQREDLLMVQGSWGGPGGKPFSDGRGEIVELFVKYNKKQIISLQVTYKQGDTRFKSQLHGGLDNGETKQISFEEGEYLVQVKGTTGNIVPGGTMVTSLTFITNKQTHGPFGSATGGAFETKAHGKVVGIVGRSERFLDSIGFITELHPGKALPATMKLGPWGGKGGREFYGGQGDIVRIVVYYNQSQINGIQTTYEQGGVTFEPVTYGSTNGDTSKITLDFPNEYLTQVKGTTAKVGFLGSHRVITSLTFITNKHTYGPYGSVKGSKFGSPPSLLVSGFYGRSSESLNQFGVFTTIDWETTYIYLLSHCFHGRSDVILTTSPITSPSNRDGLGSSEQGNKSHGLEGGSKFNSKKVATASKSQGSFPLILSSCPDSDHSSSSRSSSSSTSSHRSASSRSPSLSKSSKSMDGSSLILAQMEKMSTLTPIFGILDESSVGSSDSFSVTSFTKVEGPWGSDSGDSFYDGTGVLSELRVSYTEKQVVSLQFVYVSNGVVVEGTKIGKTPGEKFTKVVLKAPEEHIICIKGTLGSFFGQKIITSLTFVSNKAIYGPYGMVEGEEFESSGSGKVVGIFGRAGSYIDQFGVFSTSIEVIPSNIEGSWGGDGGYVFSDGQGDIVEIQINYNSDQIVSFQATYNQNGTRFPSRIHGGNVGKSHSQTIFLNFPDEHLVQVKGTFGSVHELPKVITSLSFITNKKTYGPFGTPKGEEFKSSEGSQVVGFHGQSCDFLDCIGVFTTRISQQGLVHSGKGQAIKVLAQGPWGGVGGSPFYDGRGDIVEILLEYTEDCIVSLQATYEQGGGIFKTSARFGPGGETAKIKFDPEHEQLLQIQGSIGDSFDSDMVTSLTFITNKKTYGPFGVVTDKKFESKMHGKVVGFFGRSDEFLDQIGLITEVSPKDYEVVLSQGPWGGKNGTVFYDGKGSIVGIIVTYNKKRVISLQAIYSQGSAIFKANFHGGPGGQTAKIFFNATNEELLQIKGTTGMVDGELVVTSLTFYSNKRIFGPFGSVQDNEFESSPNGKVNGFYGKAGVCLDQIGFITQFSSRNLADEVVAQGPWGGSKGNAFYGGRGEILEIVVNYNEAQILSLQMAYNHNGTSYNGERQGKDGGEMTKISLRDTDSYLVQVKGTFRKVAGTTSITSLTFVTSKQTYGPFGSTRGTHFQSYQHGKIVGFFGRSSTSIDQLGVITQIYSKSIVPKIQLIYMGPWGGQGGMEFHDGHGHIHEINVHYTKYQVVALQVVYKQGGMVLHATNHGGTSREDHHTHHAKISFKDSNECLIQVSGTYGHILTGEMITSLTFISNKQKYGPYGHETGESFNTPSGKKIMGFFGRSAAYLDQIGIVVADQLLSNPTSFKSIENEEWVLVEGPWGVKKETNFYSGRGNIVEIEVAYNKDYVIRIQTTYQENGTNFKQGAIGGQSGNVAKITLQFPDEYLVQVKGTTQEVSSLGVVVTSLTFVTNKKAYGPYGSIRGGLSFETTRHGKVMGFYGRATTCLHSIGVLGEVEDLPDIETVIVQDSWGGHSGESFYDGRGDVTEVIITYNDLHVVSFQTTYRHGWKTFKANQHGGENSIGEKQTKISLKYPEEYLVQVKGSSHLINGLTIIESLEFITNKQSYGPYGALKPQGQLKSTPKNGKIVGFFGKAGHFVDQLGVVISFPSQREDLLMVQGSWGGPGGKPFSDGRGEIVELFVKYNKKQIISLQVTYKQGDTRFKSQLHGGLDNGETKQISFEEGEYLVQVKGTTGNIVPGGTMVTSLTFITNKQTHGPFGSATGGAFETKAHGKVVGIVGRSERFLDSIGFITELHPGKALPATMKLGPWGSQGGREFYGGQGDIVRIVVYYNQSQINGIQTTYEQGGVTFEPVTYGSTSGDASEITLDFPNEYLAQVKGTTKKQGGFLDSHQLITSLTFITNKYTYGPFGHYKGSNFGSPTHRLVTGFFGSASDSLHQFGIFATANSEATNNYLRIHRHGWKNPWGAFIRREVSAAGKFLKEEFSKLPSLGHSQHGESSKHHLKLSLSGSLKPWKP